MNKVTFKILILLKLRNHINNIFLIYINLVFSSILSSSCYRASGRWLAELRSWVPGGFSLSKTMLPCIHVSHLVGGVSRAGPPARSPPPPPPQKRGEGVAWGPPGVSQAPPPGLPPKKGGTPQKGPRPPKRGLGPIWGG